MPEKKDPIEEKSHATLFVVVIALLVISSAWAVWDEVIGRRPWKHYQKEFLALAETKSLKDLKEAKGAMATEEYKKLQEEYNRVSKAYEDNPDRKAQVQEIENIDRELADLIHEFQIHRGEYQALVYVMEKQPEGEGKQALLHTVRGLEPCIEDLSVKMTAYQKRKKELRHELGGLVREKASLEEKLIAYRTRLEGVERFREALKKEKVEIKQVVNWDMGIIDRCHNCHAGINRKGFEEAKEPFKTHPMVVTLSPLGPGLGERGILDIHPLENYGCTPCHRGQGYATTTAIKAHGELEYWLTPMLRGKYAQANCFKCHDYEIDVPGGEVISLGRKLFHEYGCVGCHSVRALEREDKTRFIGPTLDEISQKVYPQWIAPWVDNPKDFRPDTKMPHFFLNKEEIRDIASYLWQVSQVSSATIDPQEFDEEMIKEGKQRLENVGCLGCHKIGDKGSNFAPNLNRVGEKIRYDYLVSWVEDPTKHKARDRMPSLRLNKEEAERIAAYLTTLKEKVPSQEAVDYNDPKRAEAGFQLIARYGCFGCHRVKGMEDRGKIGADLSEEGVKPIERFDFALLEHEMMHRIGLENPRDNVSSARQAWLTTKLKDPRIYDTGKYKKPEDKLRMPNGSLKDEEVQALVTFIIGLTDEQIPQGYKRKLSERDQAVVDGTFLIRRYNCVGCHPFSLEKLTLKDGTKIEGMAKLEEEGTLFFQLWHDYPELGKKLGENLAIEVEEIKGRIPTVGGEIVPIIIGQLGEEKDLVPEEARAFAPPFLYGEGKRVQSDWLFRFVQAPYGLRPWLDVRMPTFGLTKEEANILSKYFALLDNQEYPFERLAERESVYVEAKCARDSEYYVKAKRLMDSKDVNCGSCHVRGEIKPEGDPSGWAPDLSLAKERLRPSWVREWLTDPQRIQVGTKMPKFPWGEFQQLFPGKPEEQIEAIKDLIMSPGDLLTAPPGTLARKGP
ncbi:MAG: c-type cytochrome [Candidatus Brocadiales bacterium]|nr:c-type cytochrome [Candidatus Brocadiales bacterium]